MSCFIFSGFIFRAIKHTYGRERWHTFNESVKLDLLPRIQISPADKLFRF